MKVLKDDDVQSRPGLQDWRVLAGRLHGSFRTRSMTRGIELVRRIGEVAEELNHHPDVDLRYYRVHVTLTTHAVHGLTERDVTLAGRISEAAAAMDVEAEPSRPRSVEIAIDALDIPAVMPFWEAVLGYRPRPTPTAEGEPAHEAGSVDLEDPDARAPGVWFQQMDAPRPGRGRIHVDVHVPHDEAETRVRAALAAGGHLVTDVYAPSWWVLADPEGNEACVCTWQGRDD
ncbi:4a-hydroxytetrahydrobiopterin dehydratase [Georgenia soli]|uniref:Putative pterin-4-alpha-carbinolamine dehydratase n=1 Tax=Georgenia soli TaxID=638953 RepID=A0A2A9ERF5_9MICO|nr:4a-hydroxytetrahydrobiopterin dehydratase [Georgenia soli]PFG40799.1 4a-hydroxytetrahydrobiopterin dehydratase [Georgenia soli]